VIARHGGGYGSIIGVEGMTVELFVGYTLLNKQRQKLNVNNKVEELERKCTRSAGMELSDGQIETPERGF
jgi:hypothetical protein